MMSSVRYKAFIRRALDEVHGLLGEIIKSERESYDREKANNTPWYQRHRLLYLIEVASQALEMENGTTTAPWFFAELISTVGLVKKWKKHNIWKKLEPPLKNKGNYLHTIGKLHLFDILVNNGNEVEIIPSNNRPTPDLRLKANETQEQVFLEVYHPQRLSGDPGLITEKEVKRIVKTSMEKIRRQLSEDHPCIFCIIGQYQRPENIMALQRLFAQRLDNTSRPHLAGIIFFELSVEVNKSPSGTSFQRVGTLEYVPNPNYFGFVEIKSGIIPVEVIRRSSRVINVNEFIGNKISEIEFPLDTVEQELDIPRNIFSVPLEIMESANPEEDTIIAHKEGGVSFYGEGNQNYVCSNCGKLLAERVWKYSLLDLVFLCPECGRYVTVPDRKIISTALFKAIGLAVGQYEFSSHVTLKRGVSLIGRYSVPKKES